MQIDFHHGVTYVVSRLAGFDHAEAETIAYCAQYVDDATNGGVIKFDNGWSFSRISSAHRLLDYRNFQELANHYVWIPFHFLPGNGGLPAGQSPIGPLTHKLICAPNSYVAQDMVRECIAQRHEAYALHRLGITMHVYADTWAHQGFMGTNDKFNSASKLLDANGNPDRHLMDRLKSFFIGEALPLGHGSVLSNPDKPYLRWGYINGDGDRITRNNPEDFLAAAQHLHMALQRYRLGDADASVPGLLPADADRIAQCFKTFTDANGKVRHQAWMNAIKQGLFSFGPTAVTYVDKGKDSWKFNAIGTEKLLDSEEDVFQFRNEFFNSNWKHFHDALLAHRFYILHKLLPVYGICMA